MSFIRPSDSVIEVSIISVWIVGLVLFLVLYESPYQVELSRTPPVPVEPNYYPENKQVRSYPATASTHILKERGDVYVVFQMETEYRPIVLKSKLNGVCE